MEEYKNEAESMTLIDEIRHLTASVVSEKNKKEIENYPNIIASIKKEAIKGKSHVSFAIGDFTVLTRSKLVNDGFAVTEKEQLIPPMAQATYGGNGKYKTWVVSW